MALRRSLGVRTDRRAGNVRARVAGTRVGDRLRRLVRAMATRRRIRAETADLAGASGGRSRALRRVI